MKETNVNLMKCVKDKRVWQVMDLYNTLYARVGGSMGMRKYIETLPTAEGKMLDDIRKFRNSVAHCTPSRAVYFGTVDLDNWIPFLQKLEGGKF